MTNSQRLATVRARLLRWLSDENPTQHSSSPTTNPIVSESILVRDGFYCGRRFNLSDHRAVWFLEEDELKIYSADGVLQCVLPSSEISQTPGSDIDSAVSDEQEADEQQSDEQEAVTVESSVDDERIDSDQSNADDNREGDEPVEENRDESGQVISIQIQPQEDQSSIRRAA